jgi:hypothetical protein
LEVADDAVDDPEDSAFLAGLLSGRATCLNLPTPLLGLSELVVDGAHAFQRAIGAAQYVHRGGERESMQQFLEAVDHVVTIEPNRRTRTRGHRSSSPDFSYPVQDVKGLRGAARSNGQRCGAQFAQAMADGVRARVGGKPGLSYVWLVVLGRQRAAAASRKWARANSF